MKGWLESASGADAERQGKGVECTVLNERAKERGR